DVTGISVSPVEVQELRTFLGTQLADDQLTRFARMAGVRSATMKLQFNFDEPVAPWATSGVDRDRIEAFVAATEGIEDRVTSAARITLPTREAIDPELARSLVVSRTEPAVQYRR